MKAAVCGLKKPFLLPNGVECKPTINAQENIEEDTRTLLDISLKAHEKQKESLWFKVLPIYITSPVSSLK